MGKAGVSVREKTRRGEGGERGVQMCKAQVGEREGTIRAEMRRGEERRGKGGRSKGWRERDKVG